MAKHPIVPQPEFISVLNITVTGNGNAKGPHLGAYHGKSSEPGIIVQASYSDNPNWAQWHKDADSRLFLRLDIGDHYLCYDDQSDTLSLEKKNSTKYKDTTWDVTYANQSQKYYFLYPTNAPADYALAIKPNFDGNSGAPNCLQIVPQDANDPHTMWYMQAWN